MLRQCKSCQAVLQNKYNTFCNSSCAASYNNKQYPKRSKLKYYCACGNQIHKISKSCITCRNQRRSIKQVKKGDLFNKRKGYQSARSAIRKHAAADYNRSSKPKYCIVCGYDKHYEVCHIKSVSSFADIVTMEEINHIDNLIALCPNCHWEFDHGLLVL